MNDSLRESLSYFGLYRKMFQVRKKFEPVKVSYGTDREQYFLYYEPDQRMTRSLYGFTAEAGMPVIPGSSILSVSVSASRDIVLFLWATDCLRSISIPVRSGMSARHTMPRSAI